jgi:hypothetical protein
LKSPGLLALRVEVIGFLAFRIDDFIPVYRASGKGNKVVLTQSTESLSTTKPLINYLPGLNAEKYMLPFPVEGKIINSLSTTHDLATGMELEFRIINLWLSGSQ